MLLQHLVAAPFSMSQKNKIDVAHYNFNEYLWISVIFGRDVVEIVQ